MAEEFEGGVCGGNWAWNSSRNLFSSSPCSLASFGWPNHDVSDDSAGSTSDGSGSVVIQKPSPDGFGMMGISLLSSSAQEGTDWNQDLMNDSGRSEHNYSNFVMNSNMNYEQISSSLINTTTTCFPISSSTDTFPLNSASYNYTSSLLQTLFDTDSQPQQSLLDYQVNSNGFLPNFPKPSPMPNNHLPNAPLWNPDLSNGTPSTNFPQSHHFLPSTSLDNNKRPNHPSFGAKVLIFVRTNCIVQFLFNLEQSLIISQQINLTYEFLYSKLKLNRVNCTVQLMHNNLFRKLIFRINTKKARYQAQ
ncbi:hypothetical protein ACS0TY_031169 [Phlomoides rotata]